ncbi:hypothetical protein [Membranihabitans marinus]|uniref:hypothetical protein n=1 Tax=Membranihabitans marinus TaxID=1227546 RepID=UPI001F492CAA|nr:hypothetical protein [Membranihabitans marinus]
MKNVKGVFIIVLVLFAIPIAGYFVLKQGAKDRMEISGKLQPKGQIDKNLSLIVLENDELDTVSMMDMPYILKVIANGKDDVNIENLEKIIHIINDRTDLAFFVIEEEVSPYKGERIYTTQFLKSAEDILKPNEVILLDWKNQILQRYDLIENKNVYGALLEDISYALPMIDYKIEQENK